MSEIQKRFDITNQRFGYLTAIKKSGFSRRRHIVWDCVCDCGNHVKVKATVLRQGVTRSCGCLKKRLLTTHGKSDHPDYKIWLGMIQRCHDKNAPSYFRYGQRGITVCDDWRSSPDNFFKDMGPRPKGLSLDRIDNDKGYSPENCRWADSRTQNGNRKSVRILTHGGKSQCIAAWARETGIHRDTIKVRLRLGWSVEKTLKTEVRVHAWNRLSSRAVA